MRNAFLPVFHGACGHCREMFCISFGSAWITHDNMWQFEKYKDRFTLSTRIPRGFKEALEAVDVYIKTGKANVSL